MAVDADMAIARRRDSVFAGLVCATLGLVLVESANILAKGSITAHGASLIVGVAIISLTLSAFLKSFSQPYDCAGSAMPPRAADKFRAASIAACAVIGCAGYGASSLFFSVSGLVSPFFLFVGGLIVTPWRWVARSRGQYMACWAAVLTGVGSALVLHGRIAVPFFFLAGFGCYLWTIALACWLLAIFNNDAIRKAAGKPLA